MEAIEENNFKEVTVSALEEIKPGTLIACVKPDYICYDEYFDVVVKNNHMFHLEPNDIAMILDYYCEYRDELFFKVLYVDEIFNIKVDAFLDGNFKYYTPIKNR